MQGVICVDETTGNEFHVRHHTSVETSVADVQHLSVKNMGNPKVADDFARTTSMCASRATFLAGFTYYQCGRYRYTPAGYVGNSNDTAYVVLCTLSFQFAVVTTCISAVYNYYLESVRETRHKIEFCEATRWVVRGTE